MDSIQWDEFWGKKSEEKDLFSSSGRSKMDIMGFLATLRDIKDNLEFNMSDDVLDIGCGPGIITYAIAPWVNSVQGVDFCENMVSRARMFVNYYNNVCFCNKNITDLSDLSTQYDKILVYSVLQYLTNISDVEKAMWSIKNVMKKNGKVFFAANPDPGKKNYYLNLVENGYDNQKTKEHIKKINDYTLWLSFEDLETIARKAGIFIKRREIPGDIWQSRYMFNAIGGLRSD